MVHGCRQVVRLERGGRDIIGIGRRKLMMDFIWGRMAGFGLRSVKRRFALVFPDRVLDVTVEC